MRLAQKVSWAWGVHSRDVLHALMYCAQCGLDAFGCMPDYCSGTPHHTACENATAVKTVDTTATLGGFPQETYISATVGG